MKINKCEKPAFLSLLIFICISDAVATEKLCFEVHLERTSLTYLFHCYHAFALITQQ